MKDYHFWMLLILGIWFIISSAIGLYNDFKSRHATRWWKWIADFLGLTVGLSFLCDFIIAM